MSLITQLDKRANRPKAAAAARLNEPPALNFGARQFAASSKNERKLRAEFRLVRFEAKRLKHFFKHRKLGGRRLARRVRKRAFEAPRRQNALDELKMRFFVFDSAF